MSRSVAASAGDLPTAKAISAALDSCGEHTGRVTRWSGAVRSFGPYTLFLPDSAGIVESDSGTGRLKLSWPRCPDDCVFAVAVYGDSGITVETRVARMVAEQRRIDSVNRAPGTSLMEFDELDSPPRPFATPAAQGYIIDHSCGDCAATTFKFGRRGRIADVGLSADAEPGAGDRMCEMAVVARSFAWSP